MYVLLSNDDGIYAPGLRIFYAALVGAGHRVDVVAPMNEQSGVSSSVTLTMPLKVREVNEEGFVGFGVYGSPADCVKLALAELLIDTPDVVVTGINAGGNTGVDVIYSGTVAAALEAALAGLPALAVSFDSFHVEDVSEQATHAVELLGRIDWKAIPRRRVLNLNYPACSVAQAKGLRICSPATAPWEDKYEGRRDLRGFPYWWISGYMSAATIAEDSDRALLSKGYITLTPLRFEYADVETEQVLGTMLGV